MTDHSDSRTSEQAKNWARGSGALFAGVLIGVALALWEPPTWLQIAGVIAILGCVFYGSSQMFHNGPGGWKPSQTLPKPGKDQGEDSR